MIAGCKKSENSNCTPSREEDVFYQNKTIHISDTVVAGGSRVYRYQINNGGDVVFKSDYHYEVCPGSLDLDPYYTIAFQIPSGVSSFTFSDSASLRQANAVLKASCGECFADVHFLTNGYIKGKQLNQTTWSIEASLSSPSYPSAVYSINAIYKKN